MFDNRERMFSDDPDDRGGATLCGVTLNTLNDWAHKVIGPSTTYTKEELQELPFHVWLEVVKILFWKALRCDEFYSRVERGTINEKFHRGLLKRVDYIEHIQRHTL